MEDGTANNMDDAINNLNLALLQLTLALFQFELPDPQQDLFEQRLEQDLNRFIWFPKLPQELRLMIWRLSFPKPRGIYLQPRLFGGFYQERLASHPISLHVCQESRQETFRHYHVLPYVFEKLSRAFESAVCINKTSDTVYLSSSNVLSCISSNRMHDFVGRNPSFLEKIDGSEIRGHFAGSPGYTGPGRGILHFFRRLRTLTLLLVKYEDFEATNKEVDDCKKYFTKVFENERSLVPETIFRY